MAEYQVSNNAEQIEPIKASSEFKAPDGKSNLKFLEKLCRGGIIERFTKAKLDEAYSARLAQEMQFWAIHKNGLNRLLVVWDCLYWARQQHIKIADVQGPLNSSLIGYLLEITRVDPLKQGIGFDKVFENRYFSVKIIVHSSADLHLLKIFMENNHYRLPALDLAIKGAD